MCGSEELRRLSRVYSDCEAVAYDPLLKSINLRKFLECVERSRPSGD